jgi:hypothetical protein
LDKQTHEFLPPITPIDSQSAIPIQRLVNGQWVDDAITPELIVSLAATGGLSPETITADQMAVSGKIYIAEGGIFLTLPSTLIPGVTRFAITNPEPFQSFSIHPQGNQTIRLGNAIADSTKIIVSQTSLAYCECIAASSTAMIVTSGVQVGIFDYTAGSPLS